MSIYGTCTVGDVLSPAPTLKQAESKDTTPAEDQGEDKKEERTADEATKTADEATKTADEATKAADEATKTADGTTKAADGTTAKKRRRKSRWGGDQTAKRKV